MIFTDQALVVRREPWRERDKRITFFTAQHGLVQGVAVGARKMTSKLSGHLEPFRLVDVMLASGKNGYTVAQAVTIKNFATGAPRAAFEYLALYARLAEKLAEPEAKDPVLFGLLLHASEAAADGAGDPGQFLYMLAEHSGFSPHMSACVSCGSTEKLPFFSPSLGGVLCETCERPAGYVRINSGQKDSLFVLMKAFFAWRGFCSPTLTHF